MLGFVQQYRASNVVGKLRAQFTLKSSLICDGKAQVIPSESVVKPGDMVLFSVGGLIPSGGIVLEIDDYFVNQAVLAGETLPAEKTVAFSRLKPVWRNAQPLT